MGNIELPKDTEDFYPLSDIQKGMVFHSLIDSDRLLYHNQNVYRVKFRDFDENLFRNAFELMVEKHPMLRTGFNMYDFKEPIQIVHKKIIPDIEHHDISSEDNAQQLEYLKKLVMKEQQSPFDVTNAEPFWRIRSVDTGSDNIYFIWICHHAIIDGWSFAALMTEVENTYFKLKENPRFLPGKLRNTYKRFVIEQLGEKKRSRNIDFWRKELENYKRVEFPGLSPGTNGNDHKINETKTYVGVLGNELVGKLNKVAKKHNTCLKHLCFAAYIYMLNMLSYENDIVAGLVTHNRPICPDGDKIIGCFLNTIPVRVKIPSPLRWMDYILLIENKLLELKTYDRVSFFEIVRCIGEVTRKQNPIFDAMFNFTDFHIYGQMHLENDDTAQSPPGDENPDFDEGGGTNTLFDCNIAVGDGGLVVKFSFSETLINSGKAFALAGYLEKILYKFIEESEGIVRKDELISDEEKQRILIEFNRTEAEYPEDKTIPGLFKEQAKRTPDHIALIGPSIRGVVQLTYNRLDEESGRVAQDLTGRGIQPGTIAAIMVDRSVEMVVGILGILKAGGAYLPIEPGYPEERVHYMLTDSNAGVLLKKSGIRISINIPVVLDFEQLNLGTVSGLPSVPLSEPGLKPSNHAYVIYTSGSTGKPKGVIVEHGAVVNILYALFKEYPFSGEDVYLFKTSFIFDVSVTDLFGWVLGGGRSALLESGGEKDPRIILDTVERYNVTHMNFVPSMFNYFADMLSPQNIRKLAGLKFIFLAGEALLPGIIEKFRRLNGHISIENIYGPTEATIYASKYSVKDWKEGTAIPIGKPLANVKLFIIDKYDGLQAVGSIGELCIAGSGLARGYLNSPAITGEKFTDHFLESPRGGVPVRIYRTGDLTRWLPDGNIEFLGRIDRQVKIRGFRVELGEIESRLLKYGEIKEAAVVVFDEGNESHICAYIAADSTVDISELKAYLSANLPYYMIPVFFKQVEKMPLTPGGKVDRNALPHPGVKEVGRYTAPRNELEESLVEIWSEVLGIENGRVGIDANFFELGGHSLKVIALAAKIHKKLNLKIQMADIFKRPRVRELAGYLEDAAEEKYKSVEPVEKKEYYRLSSAQKRLYILQQMEPGSTAYNMPEFIPLPADPDLSKLENTFKELIKRHESFRTSFIMINDEPVQVIAEAIDLEIEYFDFKTDRDDINAEDISGGLIRPFDLPVAPLMRVGFVNAGEGKHYLLVDMHHIISDGISHEVLTKDFMSFYNGAELLPLRLQYKDFAEWQNSEMGRERLKNQEVYWLKQFEGELPVLDLPIDYPRPMVQSFEGDSAKFEISGERTQELYTLAFNGNSTLFMVLAGAFKILLSKLSNRQDIVIGTPVAGRRHVDLENIIGMFVNTLALRNYPEGEKTVKDFLYELRERTLEAFENQEYQFEELVENVSVDRDMGRNPLFDVMLVLQNFSMRPTVRLINEAPGPVLPVDTAGDYESISRTAKFDLTLFAVEEEGRLEFSFQYCTKLFKRETIERFIVYFRKILSAIVEKPDFKLWQIEIMSGEEKKRILCDFNNTVSRYPGDRTIHQLFEAQVEKTPDHIAAVGSSVGAVHELPLYNNLPRQITYRELDEKSNRLGNYLKEKGVIPGNIIGIMADRSLEVIIGILGILKTGGAYLPVEPDFPEDRKNYMLADSGAQILLTARELLIDIGDDISVTSSHPNVGLESKVNPSLNSPHNLAYVIYTSGSTGRPKGVLVEHRNVIRLVINNDYIEFRTLGRVLQTGALSFDASTFEIWGPLLNGTALVLLSKERILNPEMLKKAIHIFDISTMWMTAPLFNQMMDADEDIFTGLRNLLVGGDVLSPVHINRLRKKVPGLNIVNGYGPTENTTFSTTFRIDEAYEQNIPIGRPIANSSAYIVNSYNGLQPIGVTGELLVGGAGVSRGYLNLPGLTAEKFYRSAAPFNITPYPLALTSFYRTGDLARWLPDGNIEFLGRIDHQVKIRGFRIELGEIENRLAGYPEIKETVVICREDEGNDKYLSAYFVSGDNIPPSVLTEYLLKYLPAYMVPAYYTRLEKISLTPNGKIDRSALPEPEIKNVEGHVPPGNAVEEKLADIWAEVLALEKKQIGIEDNFFQYGGHSLKAVVMISKIHKFLNVKLPLAELFVTPTIRGLAEYIRKSDYERYAAVEPVEKKEYYRLSSAQKRLYILQQMELGSIAYNMPKFIPLPADLDLELLGNTFKELITRHESFRTSFIMINDEPVQVISEEIDFEVEYLDCKIDRSDLNVEGIAGDFIRPFDLSTAPLLRVGLLKKNDGSHLLLVDMHHIISDGLSQKTLEEDFIAFYKGKEIPPLRIQYKDFAQWQNSEKEKGIIKKQEKYWLEQFEGEIPVFILPTDFERPAVQSFEGSVVDFEICGAETAVLKQLSLEQGVTPFMLLLGVFNVLLSKLGRQEDVIVGSPIAGRRHADLEKVIGMFVNTLALRNCCRGEQTFKAFLADVKKRCVDAFENQDYQFEDLVEKVAVQRDAGRNPLFDVMFSMQNIDVKTDDGENRAETGTGDHENIFHASKFDLTLTAVESLHNLSFGFSYCTALFEKRTIERFISFFKTIVSQFAVADALNTELSQIQIITPEEKKRLLYDFNRTEVDYPCDKTIHRLFEEQAERTPDAVAVMYPGQGETADRRTLSYRQLNIRSGVLARLLAAKGSGPGHIVALMCDPSPEMIVGILAVLKTGSCCLPIDPLNPEKRISFLLGDSEANLLLTRTHPVYNGDFDGEIVNIEDDDLYKTDGDFGEIPGTAGSGLPVYMIYTSGTTGEPKGVLVKHQNLVNYVEWFAAVGRLTSEDKSVLTSSFAFDLGYTSIYPALLRGAQLHLLPKETYMLPEDLLDYICRQGITYLKITPSLFSPLVGSSRFSIETCRTLRLAVLGGEAVNPVDVETAYRVCPHLLVMDEYGPTEATIGCIAELIDRDKLTAYLARPTIGKPIFNTKSYVLDKYLNPLPVGVVGELCLGGAGVAEGYFKREAATSEKFINNPFTDSKQGGAGAPYHRLYKTGDLARWMPDGNIEFLGRGDHQVKIRGYRIELGEIENRLLAHESVTETAVVALPDEAGGQYLCAYIVPSPHVDHAPGVSLFKTLKEYLSLSLPGYMVPTYFIELKALPLTPNGKIDRKALPAPQMKVGGTYVAPRDNVEETLVEIWAGVLGIESSSIGIDANFFELGGHSLKATAMIARVFKVFNVRLPLLEIFKTPSIRGLVECISRAGHAETGGFDQKDDNLVLLKSSPGSSNHLFLIHDGTGEVEGYLEFCKRLTRQLNCWGLRTGRLETLEPQNLTIEALARKYIQKIKKVQPSGPYAVAGWSLGGPLAFEIALRLEQLKEEIGFFALIDSPPPHESLWKNAFEFDLESELNFIAGYDIPGEMITKLKNTNGLEQFWLSMADYLETSGYDVEMIKSVIAEFGVQVLPGFHQLDLRESLYYLNVGRTLRNARALYIPSEKLNTSVHYFAADQSGIIKEEWNRYTKTPIKSYKITGDHFSIFKMPDVEPFAKLFDIVFQNRYNQI